MSLFSTEFYLTDTVGRAEFLAEARAWVQGMKQTELFGPDCTEARDGDNVRYQASNGESLMFRALGKENDLIAVGCRHDLLADDGLNWRTEAVMRRTTRGNLLRVRAQCLPTRPLAVPVTPKRTHLIRSLIENGRARNDGPLAVQTSAHRLRDDDEGFGLAAEFACGDFACSLPVVYVSAPEAGSTRLDDSMISKLALNLCGVAHVVVEPSRAFSFAVRDRSKGRNVYAGTAGISVSGRGFVRRMFIGPAYPDASSLAEAIRSAAVELRNATLGDDGWDWHDLQDHILADQQQALADQRRREARRLSIEDNEKLWSEELAGKDAQLASKDERIEELEAQISGLQRSLPEPEETAATHLMPAVSAPEIYQGEFGDRIAAALRFCLEKGSDAGWDNRSLAVFERMLTGLSHSNALDELREDLRRATRDPRRANTDVRTLLERHGFVYKSDNRHTRLEPGEGFDGLANITLASTPSEYRGLKNLCSQIEGIMGITRLKQDRR